MELILDTANIEDIKDLYTYLCIDGVTTNPSIASKEGKNFATLIKEIDEVVDEETPIHAQVVSTRFEDMIEEALYISGL